MDMYLKSVGRSVNLLLDVPPNQAGLVGKEEVDALMGFKGLRDAFLGKVLTKAGMNVTASKVRGGNASLYGPGMVLDGNVGTYWTMDDDDRMGWVEVDLGGSFRVEAVILQEHIALGQRIGGYVVEAYVGSGWRTVVTGTSLGYKRIDRLATAVDTSRVRLRISQANAVPLIQSVQILGVRS